MTGRSATVIGNGAHADVVVVGGGAIGCAIALELRKRGAGVVLVERDSVAAHASGFAYGGLYATAGAGIPGPVLPVAKQCVEHHRRLAEEIKGLTGLDTGLRPTGTIEVAFDDRRLDSLKADAAWQTREGFKVELLGAADLAKVEPLLGPEVIGGAMHSSHFEVDSYQYTFGLGWAFEKLGGQIRQGTVTAVNANKGRADGVTLSDGTIIPAGTVVLATGPWAGTGEVAGAPALRVRPVKGEILRLEFPGKSFARRIVLDDHYIARKPDGLMWVGTTEEHIDRFDDRPTDSARDSIMAGVLRLSPALEAARLVRHTACLRPVAVDGLPIVGPLGTSEGVFVANGAGKKGILLSPAIARMIAGLVLNGDDTAVPVAFRSDRFS